MLTRRRQHCFVIFGTRWGCPKNHHLTRVEVNLTEQSDLSVRKARAGVYRLSEAP